jgi:hypothetical protein
MWLEEQRVHDGYVPHCCEASTRATNSGQWSVKKNDRDTVKRSDPPWTYLNTGDTIQWKPRVVFISRHSSSSQWPLLGESNHNGASVFGSLHAGVEYVNTKVGVTLGVVEGRQGPGDETTPDFHRSGEGSAISLARNEPVEKKEKKAFK